MSYTVITKVPKPPERGNMASALGEVWVDPQAVGGMYSDPLKPIESILGDRLMGLFLQIPVFRQGEVLVLNESGRDQFGRKPSKWDVETETFNNPEAAFFRAREVADHG